MYKRFKLKELIPNMYRAYGNKEAEIRAKILIKFEQVDQTLTMQTIAEECQRIINYNYKGNLREAVITSTGALSGTV